LRILIEIDLDERVEFLLGEYAHELGFADLASSTDYKGLSIGPMLPFNEHIECVTFHKRNYRTFLYIISSDLGYFDRINRIILDGMTG
jgi:hypothetical protein